MSYTPLAFAPFVDTTSSEQNWQIFNAISGTNPAWTSITLSNYSGTNPGTVQYFDANGSVVLTLTLTYDGSGNLTSVVRS